MRRSVFIKIATASIVSVSTAAISNVVLSQSESSPPTRSSKAVPFKINVPQARLNRILERVRNCEWPDEPAKGGWEYGPNLSYMKELAAYWVKGYDWRKVESAMNRFAQYKAQIDGEALHFFQEKGSGRNPQPLLLLHGWPYSFYSLLNMAEPLAHPERFGGNATNGFDVIVPSLPGFGFSEKPANPLGPRAIAKRMHQLMTDVLG